MAAAGPYNFGTFSNDASIGSNAWSNTSNAASSDNSRATASVGAGSPSNYLKAVNANGASVVPAGATIDGIVVEVERSNANLANVLDNAVRIVKGGTIGSTDKSSLSAWPISSADAYATYGGASDLWGETWSDTDINSATFGFAISAKRGAGKGPAQTAQIDHIRVTVYYTAAGSSNTSSFFLLF